MKASLYVSIFLHVAVIGTLLFYDTSPSTVIPQVSLAKVDDKKIVKAVSIDQNALDAHIKKIKRKEANEKAEARALKRSIQKAKAAKRKEQQRLAKLKREKAKLKKSLEDAKRKKLATEKATLKAKKEMSKAHEQKKKLDKEVKDLASKQAQAQQNQEKLRQEKLQEEAELERIRREKAKIDAEKKRQQDAANRARIKREVNRYAALIRASIEQNWLQPSDLQENIRCKIKVKLLPTGEIISAKIVEASGNRAFDESALRAVYKSAPLPVPQEQAVFKDFRELTLPFQPS